MFRYGSSATWFRAVGELPRQLEFYITSVVLNLRLVRTGVKKGNQNKIQKKIAFREVFESCFLLAMPLFCFNFSPLKVYFFPRALNLTDSLAA